MVLACQQVHTSTAPKAKLQLYFYLCCQVYMQLGIYHTLLLSVNNTKSSSLIISITTIMFQVQNRNKQLERKNKRLISSLHANLAFFKYICQ